VGLAACGVGVGAPWRCGAGGEPLSAPQRRCCGGVLRGYKRGAEGRVVDAAVVVFWQPIKRAPRGAWSRVPGAVAAVVVRGYTTGHRHPHRNAQGRTQHHTRRGGVCGGAFIAARQNDGATVARSFWRRGSSACCAAGRRGLWGGAWSQRPSTRLWCCFSSSGTARCWSGVSGQQPDRKVERTIRSTTSV
jgi:hypothetical protein